MGVVIHRIDCPAMLVWIIVRARESGILKTETHARRVNVWGDTNDGVHQLVEQAAMRNNEIASGRSMQQGMQRLPCTQV